jgi:pimeloyl-ACP methyl ester carboxylesterase
MPGRAVRRRLGCLGAGLLAIGALLVAGSLYDRPPLPPGKWLSTAGLTPRFETVDGHRIRYVRAGRGPAVVLVHGFGSSIYTWKDVIPGLAADHDVVALDLPGFGGSDQPADLSFLDLPRAVLGLVNRLDLPRTALVGNSMGGAAVALVAALHPERVSALVLVDAAGFDRTPRDRPAVVRLAASSAGSMLEWLPARRLLVRFALRQVFANPSLVSDERVSEYLAAAQRPGTLASIRSLSESTRSDAGLMSDALRKIRAPTLVLWGREDRWIPLAHADRLVAAIPDAHAVVIDGCGHVPQEEKPEEVLRLLRKLLATSARE